MTRRQLIDFLRSPLAIYEEFWVCKYVFSKLSYGSFMSEVQTFHKRHFLLCAWRYQRMLYTVK